MKQTIQTKHLLNLNETCAAPLLEQFEYPWQALPHISDFIISLGKTLSPDEYEQKAEHVWLHGPPLYSLQPILQVQPLLVRTQKCAIVHSSEEMLWLAPIVLWAILPN